MEILLINMQYIAFTLFVKIIYSFAVEFLFLIIFVIHSDIEQII